MDRNVALVLLALCVTMVQIFAFGFEVDGQILSLTTGIIAAIVGYLGGRRRSENRSK